MCRQKHVEQLKNIGIISSSTRLHLVGSFYEFYITMHGSMNIKLINLFRHYKVSAMELYNNIWNIIYLINLHDHVLTDLSGVCQGKKISSHFYITTTLHIFVIPSNALSDDGLNRRQKLITVVNCWLCFRMNYIQQKYILTFTAEKCHLKIFECTRYCQLLFVSLA